MPALVDGNVGSPLITIGAEGTIWGCLDAKNDLNDSRISFAVNIINNLYSSVVNILKNNLQKYHKLLFLHLVFISDME